MTYKYCCVVCNHNYTTNQDECLDEASTKSLKEKFGNNIHMYWCDNFSFFRLMDIESYLLKNPSAITEELGLFCDFNRDNNSLYLAHPNRVSISGFYVDSKIKHMVLVFEFTKAVVNQSKLAHQMYTMIGLI